MSGHVHEMGFIDKQKNMLLNRGINKGAKITMLRHAPFGDPLMIRVRDTDFAIRKADADKIIISDRF